MSNESVIVTTVEQLASMSQAPKTRRRWLQFGFLRRVPFWVWLLACLIVSVFGVALQFSALGWSQKKAWSLVSMLAFIEGIAIVDRRLRPTRTPVSKGRYQFSLVHFLYWLTILPIMLGIVVWIDREHRRVVEKSNQRVEQIMKRSQTIDELDAIGIQATAEELEHVGWQPEDDIAAVRAKLGR
ncbi:MAG TPA: hypothetical protein VGN12_08640 [Pirellulales bacterium]